MVRVDLRVITINVPQQEMMTRDNVPVSVDAVVYFRVIDPEAAKELLTRLAKLPRRYEPDQI